MFKNKITEPRLHPTPERIAHACGGYNNCIYNNCEDALLHNIGLGFEWFEIDFIYKDNELVTDAGRSAEITGDDRSCSYYSAKDEGKASSLVLKNTSAMTLVDLARVMCLYPKIRIVVDNKEESRNMESMSTLFDALPDAAERVLPQIFQPEEFQVCAALGFKHVIWTLYNYKGSDEEVISELKKMMNLEEGGSIGYVTMPQTRAMTQLSKDVNKLNIPILAHTINDQGEIDDLRRKGVSEVYTDWCIP